MFGFRSSLDLISLSAPLGTLDLAIASYLPSWLIFVIITVRMTKTNARRDGYQGFLLFSKFEFSIKGFEFFIVWPYAVFHKMQVVSYKKCVFLCISNIYER